MRVAVLSDTHAPRRWTSCPPEVARNLEATELILHAGDVCTVDVLQELAAFAPVRAVQGNNDGPDIAAWGAPEVLAFDCVGVRIGMIHDSGPATGRLPRLLTRFPDADLVVFGHSHIPWNEERDGRRILNPGSPTDRRRQPHGTMALLDINDGQVTAARIIEVT